MRRSVDAVPVPLAAVAIAVAMTAPALAFAEGLTAYAEPSYTHTDTRTTDASTGQTSTSTTDQFGQRYTAGLLKTFLPLLRLDASGVFDKTNGWTTTNGVSSRSDAWDAGGSARLGFGPPILNGDLSYDRRDAVSGSTLSLDRTHDISDVYAAHLGWHPADLPMLDLRVSRAENRDADRRLADMTSDEVLASVGYNAIRQLGIAYTLGYGRSADHLTGTTSTNLLNTGRATYSDTFNAGRTSALASYSFTSRVTDTAVLSGGGLVTTPVAPLAGLSTVDRPPAVPENDTLATNATLVDGNLSQSAGINVGYSVSLSGDRDPRGVGVQFTDPNTLVNMIHVYVNQVLPPEIVGAFTWTAYRSDDNVHWMQVPIVGSVVFGAFQNRFEIPLSAIHAPYVKVVTLPLPVALTSDRRYADILVTEVQPLQVVPAEQVRGRTSFTSQSANGAFRQVLLDVPQLAYDAAATLSHSAGATSYSVQNGLSVDHRVSRTWKLSARAARLDSGSLVEGHDVHTGSWQYSASIAGAILPALTQSLTYSGSYAETPHGTADLNSITYINRAALYRGVDALLSAGYSYNIVEDGSVVRGPIVLATLSLAPATTINMSTSFYYSAVSQSGGTTAAVAAESERVDGTISATPFPALYLSASVQRIIKGPRPTTLVTFGGTFTPFPDGSVLLRTSYTQTLDTGTDSKGSNGSVSLRWTFIPHAYLDAGYSVLGSSSPQGTVDSKVFTALLGIEL